ncbi:uncharacterized protein VICG_01126 [Vittaforma corneae ATCC 50505]|uniref:chitin synthase n=1 Tax=Vittaforma corneae (strain ATCC 50505) TaxID=993615 RepID=L2GMB4_VITCO|nr:uncharacterized protein VICG_01126 [Vittaforma corneae ATCC 50505]ELA41774.1 hypothetical protein VICG_01126 [Vittaforma corneae ATCC 50505]
MLSRAEILRNSSRATLPSPPARSLEEEFSFWQSFSRFMTILIPDCVLRRIGKMDNPARIQAWREKVTLCILIFFTCMLLGFITYGINLFVCKGSNIIIYGKIKPSIMKTDYILANGGIFEADQYYGNEIQNHLFARNIDACKQAFGGQLLDGDFEEKDFIRVYDLHFDWADVEKKKFIVIDNKVYDPTYCTEPYFDEFIKKYAGGRANTKGLDKTCLDCFKYTFLAGKISTRTAGCIFGDVLLWLSTVVIFSLIFVRFFLAMFYAWYMRTKPVSIRGTTPCILQVTCYSEGMDGLKSTLDSLTLLEYDPDYKLIIVVADGDIKGAGNELSTPQILLNMCQVDNPEPKAYISLAPGHRRFNQAKVHTGYYEKDGKRARIMIINKVGNPNEISKKGNRGKRDSQVILMSFFSKILYGDRMSELDFEIYRKMSMMFPRFKPEDFEILLMVDADTIVHGDALVKIVSAFEKDPKIMGLCGETQILNKNESWVTRIQVFEYYISHHLTKNFESVFGGVTCLPGCFCTYRIKIVTDEMGQIKNHTDKKTRPDEKWECVPLLANPLIVNAYSVYEAKTLHEQNLLHLGEDRYLTTLLMKNFYKRKLIFVPSAKCSTYVPADYKTLRSQRRRWINSTIHNMFELVCVDKLCGTFCFSMQFAIGFELFGTLTLPAAIVFTGVLLVSAFITEPAWIPLIMLVALLGLPAVLIMLTTFEIQYWFWLIIYIFALPIWNFFLPVYAFWRFDDISWGDTRKVNEKGGKDEVGLFDSSSVKLKHLEEFMAENK